MPRGEQDSATGLDNENSVWKRKRNFLTDLCFLGVLWFATVQAATFNRPLNSSMAVTNLPRPETGAINLDQHVVQPGETLSQIAESYDVSVDQLVALNRLLDPDLILPGQTITIAQLH